MVSFFFQLLFSAGVGRTGTFITIDIALQQIEKEGIVNIPGIINELRHQRTRMVQTIVSDHKSHGYTMALN